MQHYLEKGDIERYDKCRWLLDAHDEADTNRIAKVVSYYENKQNRIQQEVDALQRKMRRIYNKTKAYLRLSKKLKEDQSEDQNDLDYHQDDMASGIGADLRIEALNDEALHWQEGDQESTETRISQEEIDEAYLLDRQKQAANLTQFSSKHFDVIKNKKKQKEVFLQLQTIQCQDMQDRLQGKLRKGKLMHRAVLQGNAEAATDYAELHGLESYRLQSTIIDLQERYCKAKAKSIAWKNEDAGKRVYNNDE